MCGEFEQLTILRNHSGITTLSERMLAKEAEVWDVMVDLQGQLE